MAGEGESLEAYIDRQEERLAAVLSEIDGVGAVYVMITASASRELVVEKDVTEEADVTEEEDTNGGRRSVKNNTRSEVSVTDYTSAQPCLMLLSRWSRRLRELPLQPKAPAQWRSRRKLSIQSRRFLMCRCIK